MISVGLETLFTKEVRRFLRVPGQTLVSPIITTTLYFMVFGYSIGSQLTLVHGVPYARFITPGLVMLGVITNSFMNSSSSLFMMKVQGTVVDLLVSPLSHAEVLVGFVGAAMVRGVLVGTTMWVVAALFTTFHVEHPLWALAFLLLVATFFGTAGLLVAIWAEKFEQINLVPTFLITPLTFLGGVFFSVDRLPDPFRALALANPVLYMVEGLRFGMLGASDVPPALGLGMLLAFNAVALATALRWLRSGYRLRS